jgi:DNA polymerase III delta prime subunit
MIGQGEILWSEIYRPHKVSECIIPDALKATFQSYVDKKEIPNLLLTGSTGTGKTSVAKALCDEIGADYIFINGSLENGVDILRTRIQGFGSSVSFTGGRKVIIVDEADNLTSAAQLAFRGVIEELSVNCSFIFTCNYKNRIIEAIHSRCATIEFKLQAKEKVLMAQAFNARVGEILSKEKIEFEKPVVGQLIKKYFPDYRKILNELQKFASKNGAITEEILSQVSDAKIDEMIGYLKTQNFAGLRKWVATNSDNDSLVVIRALYDKMEEIFKPKSLPVLVVLTGRYLFQATSCLDQEINLAAYLTEVMVECEVK